MQIGRRILFNKNTGKIIMDTGEMQGHVTPREPLNEEDIGIVELEFGAYTNEFSRAIRFHIDPITKDVVFEELAPVQPTYEELQIMVEMLSEGVI